MAEREEHRSRPSPEASTRTRGAAESAKTRQTAPIYGFVAFLLIVGAFLVVVGIHDTAFAHASVGVGGGAAILVVVGVVLVVAGCRLATRVVTGPREVGESSPYDAGVLVVVAFLLTIFVCVYVLLAAGRAAQTQRFIVYVVTLVIFAVALMGLLLFGRAAEVSVRQLGAAVALGVIGTVIGLWEFWYQNQYVPSHAGRAVALNASLRVVGQQKGYSVVRATITYEDIGGRAVSVIGSTYTVTGSRVVRCVRPTPPARTLSTLFKGFLVDPQRSRYMADVWEESPATLLGAGKFVGDGKRLDPNVSSGRDLVFFVSRGHFELLRFRAQLFAIPASVQLSQRTLPEYMTFPPDNELYGFWQVANFSWLHDLINGRQRWVVIRYELVRADHKNETTPSPDFRVTARFPDPTWTERRPNRALVEHLFRDPTQPADSSEPFADTELPLEAVARPTAQESAQAHLPACRRGA